MDDKLQALKLELEQFYYRKALLKIRTLDNEGFFGFLKNINDATVTILNDRNGFSAIVRLDRIASVIQLTPFEAEVR